MPVTARLSKLFYERLGEEVTNELVDWFNAVDATYRGDLRELNELNFARFDARVEQRFAESEARAERRFVAMEARFDKLADSKLDTAVFEHTIAHLDAKIDRRAAELQVALEKGLKEQTKFMFLAWSALLIPIMGLWFRG